jgi:N-acetylglucosamine malate deacetylase 1
MSKDLDILAFAAHPDDVELSCSGTLMKHISEGKRVGVIDLTEGELGSRGSVSLRYEEAENASKIMGLTVRENLKMRDGFFEINEENKLKIVTAIRTYRPKIVLANAIEDRHPDHGRAAQLVSEACFLAGLRKVETIVGGQLQEAYRPQVVYHYIQDRYVKPDFVVDITPYIERKMEAIQAYKSQFYDPNSTEPQTPISGADFLDFLKARGKELGRPIGVQYAEGFTAERLVGVESFFDLV